MDVSQPNNWPRVEGLFRRKNWQLTTLGYGCVDDKTTAETMRELAGLGYISEPHAAIAYRLLCDGLQPEKFGLFLGTAHSAKFKESVESILQAESATATGAGGMRDVTVAMAPSPAPYHRDLCHAAK